MEVCTQFKMDMSDPTLGPDQKCKICQNAKKLHTAAPQKTTPVQPKPNQQPNKPIQVKPAQLPNAQIVPKPIEPIKQETKIEIKANTEQKQDDKQKGCDNFKLDMKDQAIGDAVKCLNCGIPKGQHNFQKQVHQPPKVEQQKEQPRIVVEPPKQPIKQPQIIPQQKPIQVPNNQPSPQLPQQKQGEQTNLIIKKQLQHEQQDQREKQDDGVKACDSFQLDMTDTQIGDAIRCKKCSQPKSVHVKPATQGFVKRLSVQPAHQNVTQDKFQQILNDASKLDTKDPPSRQSLQPQLNKPQEEQKPTFVQQIAIQQQQKLQQKPEIVQKEDGKNTQKSHLQEPQNPHVRPSLGIQPPTDVKQSMPIKPHTEVKQSPPIKSPTEVKQIPTKPKNDDFGQDDFKNLLKGVKDFNDANNLQKIAEDADKKLNDEVRQPSRTMMPPGMRIPGMGQPPKKNPLEEKQSNESIDALKKN
ncbi:hypothetical protein pb186bvf_013112 [Paramecium bursaria]